MHTTMKDQTLHCLRGGDQPCAALGKKVKDIASTMGS